MPPQDDAPDVTTVAGRHAAIAASLYYTLEAEKGFDVGVVYEALTPAYRRYLESVVAVALHAASLWQGVRVEAPPIEAPRRLTLVRRGDIDAA